MKGAASSRGSRPALCILLVLCMAHAALAQLGSYSRPSDFNIPSQRMGQLGGRYSSYGLAPPASFMPLAPDTNPLNVNMAPRDGYGGGMRTSGQGGAASPFSPAYSPVPSSTVRLGAPMANGLGAPMANGLGAPMASPMPSPMRSSVPQYGATRIPGRNTLFHPTVEADSFAKMLRQRKASLDSITSPGPTAGALEPKEPAPATQPSAELAALQQMSQHQAARLSDKGAACLQRAMEALKGGRFRGESPKPGTAEPYKPGAIDLFKQARLLLGEQPEPTLGLIASLVSTGDYSQAAALVGPLVSKWPEVMARDDFSREFYARPEQARTQSLAIREIALERGDSNLRLLWVFYRWHMESKQAAAGDVVQIARQQGPDSAAMAMTRAMVAALGTGG